jgi:thiol-disulfide isomerase/thioredoxin
MKQGLFILAFLIALLFSSISKSQDIFSKTGKFYPEVEQRSVVFGRFVNMHDFPEAPKSIELEVDDITIDYPHVFKTEINDNGEFIFDIPLYHSMNSYLNYGDGRITPYIFPNDTLNTECEIGEDGFKFRIIEIEFDRDHDKFQKKFLKQHEWLYNSQLSSLHDRLSKDLTAEQFKKQSLDFEKVLLDRINIRVETDSLNNIIADYLKYSATYSIYRAIIRESTKIESQEERQQLLSFLDDSVIFNKDAMLTSAYNTFLNTYNSELEPREGFGIETNGKTKEQVQWEIMLTTVENSFKRRYGIWAEYLGATYIYNSIIQAGITQSEISLYSKLISEKFKDNYIRQFLLSMCSNKENHEVKKNDNLLTPKNTTLTKYAKESGEKILDKILEDNKGKVIYIDIWATWCSPCIKLFEHSHRMRETLNNENVVFIYLCCRSDEDNWKNIIKSHQLTGAHILLNQKQNDELQTKLSINALPQFILVDSKGIIVNYHAPKPDTEEILVEINKLLLEYKSGQKEKQNKKTTRP